MNYNYRRQGKFWGILLLVIGVSVILSQFEIIPILTWRQIVGIVLIGVAAYRLIRLEFWHLVTPTLVGLWFLKGTFPVLKVAFRGTDWWMLLIAGLLIDAGLRYIFKPQYSWERNHKKHNRNLKDTVIDVEVSDEDERVFNENNTTYHAEDETSVFYVNAKLGSTTRYINSKSLKEVYLNASLSGVEIYFNRSVLQDGVGYLTVDVNMSGVEIYIPREWRISLELSPLMGGVDEVGTSTGDGSQTLYIRGKCSMAGIEIIYV